MFKNTNSKKVTGILLALVLVTACFIGGSIARYVTSTSSEDDARVAKWGFSETPEPVTMNLFKNEYKLDGNTVVAKSNDDADIIAPGLNGVSKFKFVTSSVSPEVMYEVKISVDDSEIAPEIKNHPGIQWKVDNGNWVTWDEMVASLVALSGDPSGYKVYAPGELHDNFKSNVEHTIAWQWLMDAGYDEEDTAMGNLAASGTPITAKIIVTVLAQQTDVDSTGMLEGNGSVYNTNDPQPLTFRADADYETFDSVKIDGTTINSNNYETEEGSIIVKLNKNYLKNLSKGKHTITIVTDDKEIKSNFTVTTDNTIIHNGIIPEGGKYYQNVESDYDTGIYLIGEYINGTLYEAGDEFPPLQLGDVYVYNGYEYRYNMYSDGYQWFTGNSNGWSVIWLNNSSTAPNILSTINGKNLTNMDYTYENKSIINPPFIPESVNSMYATFFDCRQMKNIPTIPNNVANISCAFSNCSSLPKIVTIGNINPNYYDYAFDGTPIQWIEGEISDTVKQKIAERSNIQLINIVDGGDTTKTGIYYKGVSSNEIGDYTTATAKYINGASPKQVDTGDIYVEGDYEYKYTQDGWGVKVLDGTKTSYGNMLSTIANKPVTDLSFTFAYTPVIIAPQISNNAINMLSTFADCDRLTTAPTIPASVKDMDSIFLNCRNLRGTIEINANPTSYGLALEEVSGTITLTGYSTKLYEIAATAMSYDYELGYITNENVTVIPKN